MIRPALQPATVLCLLGVLILSTARPAIAAIESRSILKTYFETGDTPTEQQFASLIDSQFNLLIDFGSSIESHSVRTSRLGIRSAGSEQKLARFGVGDPIGPAGPGEGWVLEGSVGATSDWVGESGFLGLEFELDTTGIATTHYGFVQMSVDGPSSATPYAIRVDAFAYQTEPNTPITTFTIPEPGTCLLALAGLSALGLRRSR